MTPGDVSSLEGKTQAALADRLVLQVEKLFAEASRLRGKRNLAVTVLKFVVITVGWMGLVWVLARNRHRVDRALLRVTVSKTGKIKSQTLRMVGRQNLAPLLRGFTAVLFSGWSV